MRFKSMFGRKIRTAALLLLICATGAIAGDNVKAAGGCIKKSTSREVCIGGKNKVCVSHTSTTKVCAGGKIKK